MRKRRSHFLSRLGCYRTARTSISLAPHPLRSSRGRRAPSALCRDGADRDAVRARERRAREDAGHEEEGRGQAADHADAHALDHDGRRAGHAAVRDGHGRAEVEGPAVYSPVSWAVTRSAGGAKRVSKRSRDNKLFGDQKGYSARVC